MRPGLCLLLLPVVLLAEPADRKAAEFTLAMGGRVKLIGDARRITDVSQLPSGDFRVEILDWVGMNVDPPDLERLSVLPALRELHLPGPIWNQNADSGRDGSVDFKYLAGIQSLESITFSYHFLDSIRFRDQGIAALAPLKNLKELVVRQSAVKGHPLEPLHSLEALDVTLCPFDDEGLRHVKGMPKMKRLLIGDTVVTDAGMEALRGLTELEQLDIHGTPITDAGLANIAGLKKLKKLNLMGTAISDASIAVLTELPQLEELNLYRTKISNTGLTALKRLQALGEIDVRYSRVTQGGVDELRAALPNTRIVFLQTSARAPVRADAANLTLAEWVRKLGGALRSENGAVTEVSLAGTAVTDTQLAKLASAKTLRKLSLEGTEIGDAGLQSLRELAGLRELNISSTSVTDAGLQHLSRLPLRKLSLANTYVEGAGLKHVSAVEDLDLHASPIGNGALPELGFFPNLRRLSLAATDISDGAALEKLTKVEILDLGATDLTDAGLKPLAQLPALRTLILRDSRFTDAGLEHLAAIANLRQLDLTRNRISDKGMPALARMTQLESLTIDYGEINDKGFNQLSNLHALQALSVDSTHITDAAVATLTQFTALRELNLYHTHVTKEALERLRSALPNCRIVWDAKSNLPSRRRS